MMLNEVGDLLKKFLVEYDEEKKDRIWAEHSNSFRNFWVQKIVNGAEELQDSEIDQVVRILDRNGKGNTKGAEAVAKVMNPQGVWRRQFREIQADKHLKGILNDLFQTPEYVERGTLMREIFASEGESVGKYTLDNIFRYPTLESHSKFIDELYKYNENKKNGLTGGSGSVLNSMIFAYNPLQNLSVISLKDRLQVIAFFGFQELVDYDKASMGRKMVSTNTSIIEGFREMGFTNSPRTLSCFLYSPLMLGAWRDTAKVPAKEVKETKKGLRVVIPRVEVLGIQEMEEEESVGDSQQFGMEKELEDFLVANWEKTELGKKYDLYEEEGNLGQQFKIGAWKIDILAVEKKTKKLVVIELKRGRTSDVAVGQLIRYMGWLEEHKTKGESTKGIIIALEDDPSLYYAAKKVKDVEVFLYKVSFSLEAQKKPKA